MAHRPTLPLPLPLSPSLSFVLPRSPLLSLSLRGRESTAGRGCFDGRPMHRHWGIRGAGRRGPRTFFLTWCLCLLQNPWCLLRVYTEELVTQIAIGRPLMAGASRDEYQTHDPRPGGTAGRGNPHRVSELQFGSLDHPGVELRANVKSISHRCHLFELAFVWELTEETIKLPLGCLQGGLPTIR